ncbi:MAG: GNAT family N-acetyltransferase [Actinobacteria bacterium]|nr:GNAT family N-acetyltransferase [Actinomycetota bacterium]
MTVRLVESEADLEFCLRVLDAVAGIPLSIEQMRQVQDRLLLHPGGGYALVNHSSVRNSAYAMVRVLPSERGRGIGSELVEAAAVSARALGTDSMWGVVRAGDEGSLRFATARGFVEVGRDVELTRRLAPGDGLVRDGVVELQEEHRLGAYEVAVAAMPDMVTAGDAEARPYDAWVEQELLGPVGFVAIEDGAVVGYATLQNLGDDSHRLEHGFTGVLPAYRGRGIATALGEAQIAWAAAHGYEELTTTTGVTNVALRRQKAKLGYEERNGPILVRGPV